MEAADRRRDRAAGDRDGGPRHPSLSERPEHRDASARAAAPRAWGTSCCARSGVSSPSPKAGLALALDARLPTGDELDLLGTGATQLKAFLVGSGHFGWFNPHLNAGYTWSLEGSDDINIADEINYTVGFDVAVGPRFTFVFDAIGRTFLNTQNIHVEDTLFTANTTHEPGGSAEHRLRRAPAPRDRAPATSTRSSAPSASRSTRSETSC